MFIQTPDGLIVNFAHVVKIRKLDYVLDGDVNKPLLWLKYATGEEERIDFDSREDRDRYYAELKSILHIHML